MHGPKPPMIELTDRERGELNNLLRRHATSQQLALRARIVLAGAGGLNNGQIVRQLGVSRDMVRLWRGRWLGLQAASLDDLSVEERLTDIPRSGAPPRITAEQLSRCAKSWRWHVRPLLRVGVQSASGVVVRSQMKWRDAALLRRFRLATQRDCSKGGS